MNDLNLQDLKVGQTSAKGNVLAEVKKDGDVTAL